jgi:hypothetical protein
LAFLAAAKTIMAAIWSMMSFQIRTRALPPGATLMVAWLKKEKGE